MSWDKCKECHNHLYGDCPDQFSGGAAADTILYECNPDNSYKLFRLADLSKERVTHGLLALRKEKHDLKVRVWHLHNCIAGIRKDIKDLGI